MLGSVEGTTNLCSFNIFIFHKQSKLATNFRGKTRKDMHYCSKNPTHPMICTCPGDVVRVRSKVTRYVCWFYFYKQMIKSYYNCK